ncbi:DKNYY domain-containing protein [Myxococcus sp. CA039A]|uniref:DKNYY domain-containing protein n=1 Tax=Myxococcus sp. CA039A TaxID=2741737 RepID=UPI00157B9D47|nr:DKNYY domain-containing protein [Myxococcus sp. CA039A]NTX50002.1 DKNYY domain-containing protein [Myxococcus sp. CA039A]
MSPTRIIVLAVGVLVLVGVVLFFSGGFLFFAFRNSYEIKGGKVFYHAAGIGLSEVLGADAETFRELRRGARGYAEDKYSIYFHEQRLPGADRDSFEVLRETSYWSKDQDTVFYGASALPGVDAEHFRLLSAYYGTDGVAVYGVGRRMEGVDVATFELVGQDGAMAKDKNASYRLEERGRMVNGEFISDAEAAEDSQ